MRLDRATRSDHGAHPEPEDRRPRRTNLVALGELVHVESGRGGQKHLSQEPDAGDLCHGRCCGAIESPVYAILKLGPEIDKFKIPEGYAHRAVHGGAALRSPTATR